MKVKIIIIFLFFTVFKSFSQEQLIKLNFTEFLKYIDDQNQFELFLIQNQLVLFDFLNESNYLYSEDGSEMGYKSSSIMPSNQLSDSLNPNKTYVKGLNMEYCHQWIETEKTWAWKYTEETKRAYIWIRRKDYIKSTCEDNKKIIYISNEIEINVSTNENYNFIEQEFLKCSKFIGIVKRNDELTHEYTYYNTITKKKHSIFFVKRLNKPGGDIYIE
jgi:hypothetical protein